MQKRTFLIVTASIGSGHVKAAEAVCEEIKRIYPDACIHMVDFMSKETAYLNWLMKEIYLKMLDFLPNLYEFLYKFTAGHGPGISGQSLMAMVMQRNMAALIARYRPDAVICTHPFPAGATAYLRRGGRQDFLFATVMTDYSVHPMWVYDDVDLYFVACDTMKRELMAKGFLAEQVFATGIPVERNFLLPRDREEILQRFGLQAGLPVLLVMGGGLGLGGVDFTLLQLEKIGQPLQILVVAGQNASLWEKARSYAKTSHHRIEVWGYSHDVQDLMAAASLLISKPGALTISEALTMELPMLLHEPIPGPETDNAIYAAERGAALWIRTGDSLLAAVEALLEKPEKLQAMRHAATLCRKPYAARDIAMCLAHGLGDEPAEMKDCSE